MMAKPLVTILALTLFGHLHAADPAPATSIISWQGSAFEDGDAFDVTATIGEKEVQLVWDGFAAPEFDFLLNGKERVMEVSRTNGQWKPGKLWNKQDYYLIDGTFHNDIDFRREGR